jgi:hypothetical protein
MTAVSDSGRQRFTSKAGFTLEDRFMSKVVVVEDCWEWVGYRDREGYGKMGGACAHRVSYELFIGPIPDGLTIDHLCRNPGCVKPSHLEAVPIRVNVLRGVNNACAVNARKTHCKHGHEFTTENTYRSKLGRCCRKCVCDSQRRYQSRKSALVEA